MMQRAQLVLSFSPNPVYRNHHSDTKWYFDVLLQELNGIGATLQHLQAQWMTKQGQVQDQLEQSINIVIRPHEQALFPELWVSSSLTHFTYRVLLSGVDDAGHSLRVGGDLRCR